MNLFESVKEIFIGNKKCFPNHQQESVFVKRKDREETILGPTATK